MKRKLIALAAATLAAATIGTAGSASAQYGSPLQLSLHRCAPGTFEAGFVRFQNVGYKDFNEGARNYIKVRLCSARPNSPVFLTPGYCGGRRISMTRFRNVGYNDRYEGAPNSVYLGLCAQRPLRRRIAISAKYCPAGTRPVSAVRFQNVGNNDFNEGARNFVTIRLCVGSWV
ncbi:MAG TPA: hypothetical protein VM325_11025 [Alphaproteobacteria bacterium]|nr:hypothetical protein [Alphaproteobacteria bacterium]